MSFLAQTPISPASLATDLVEAFERHQTTYRGVETYYLPEYNPAWLNVLRNRAVTQQDALLLTLTDSMLRLFAKPTSIASFRDVFKSLYEQAMMHAYPIAFKLISEIGAISGVSLDYTLQCVDIGMLRTFEDAALTDSTLNEFASEMRRILATPMSVPREEVFRSFFEVYSEATVCHLLKERCGASLRIEKIKEAKTPTPDFRCTLLFEKGGEPRELEFFIEVKSLDVVHAPQRLPDMRNAAMDAQIDLEGQCRDKKSLPMVEHEIAPYMPYTNRAGYDPRSVRGVVETLIEKAANNFKPSQFQLGPTFALANVLRLPLPGQGVNALGPFFYDSVNGGACVSGVIWNMVFGELGSPIHKSPDFEGAPTFDGNLERAGILIDSALTPKTPGVMVLYHDHNEYRFNGLYDSRWTVDGWTNLETELVLEMLCGDFNSKDNSMAFKYAMKRV